ncbi:CotY/CotZ family spore coat protein [Virgibacillus sp. SK37]|uniref:CotY/CotZ family spore coat protein n=1 Tax=Virgibacillus sp. SK37 TaxID=403957 RepID=UPI0004D1DEC9|nr:CotY/CotZ family spore coat protein [Virgibacillus sp. SK37]AIF44116.1 Spore coat protein Z [Virgibacillus sp. SK37]
MKGCDHSSHCIKETLQSILLAQNEVTYDSCDSSCKKSIADLSKKRRKYSKKNTVPFILYGKDNKPFEATGITTYKDVCTKKKKFICIESFVFRIKSLEGECAILELLTFDCNKDNCCILQHHTEHDCTPCCQVDEEYVDDLMATGICVKVDIACFCAISCLPAVHLQKHVG